MIRNIITASGKLIIVAKRDGALSFLIASIAHQMAIVNKITIRILRMIIFVFLS
jgi:hypothetical protein